MYCSAFLDVLVVHFLERNLYLFRTSAACFCLCLCQRFSFFLATVVADRSKGLCCCFGLGGVCTGGGMTTSVSPGKASSGFNSTKSQEPLYPSMMEHSDSLWLKWVVHTWSFTITAMCMWYMRAKRNKPTSSHLYSSSTTKFRNSCQSCPLLSTKGLHTLSIHSVFFWRNFGNHCVCKVS